jgi:hypothetical protein
MRHFNDKDRAKKSSRIRLRKNPVNLTPERLAELEKAVKGAVRDGCLPCPKGWRIAKDFAVSRIAVGAIMDSLGLRVANCQLGFFRVDKTPHMGSSQQEPSPEIAAALKELDASRSLNCSAVFELARRIKTTPMKISEAANALELKIRNCQLGCF